MIRVDWTKRETEADRKARAEAEAREAKRAAALSYLAETDWMVTRSIEIGKPIPDDVKAAREEARRLASKES